jgi:hypothetical protein
MTWLTAKAAERAIFGVLYIGIASIIFWAGLRMADRGLEMRFVNGYLKRWEVGLSDFSARQGQWPVFKGNNHVAYMETLVERMGQIGLRPPGSNTPDAYRYRIDRFCGRDEEIFILCLSDRMLLFGMSQSTMNRLDKAVDLQPGLDRGRLVAWPGKNQETLIGQWRL